MASSLTCVVYFMLVLMNLTCCHGQVYVAACWDEDEIEVKCSEGNILRMLVPLLTISDTCSGYSSNNNCEVPDEDYYREINRNCTGNRKCKVKAKRADVSSNCLTKADFYGQTALRNNQVHIRYECHQENAIDICSDITDDRKNVALVNPGWPENVGRPPHNCSCTLTVNSPQNIYLREHLHKVADDCSEGQQRLSLKILSTAQNTPQQQSPQQKETTIPYSCSNLQTLATYPKTLNDVTRIDVSFTSVVEGGRFRISMEDAMLSLTTGAMIHVRCNGGGNVATVDALTPLSPSSTAPTTTNTTDLGNDSADTEQTLQAWMVILGVAAVGLIALIIGVACFFIQRQRKTIRNLQANPPTQETTEYMTPNHQVRGQNQGQVRGHPEHHYEEVTDLLSSGAYTQIDYTAPQDQPYSYAGPPQVLPRPTNVESEDTVTTETDHAYLYLLSENRIDEESSPNDLESGNTNNARNGETQPFSNARKYVNADETVKHEYIQPANPSSVSENERYENADDSVQHKYIYPEHVCNSGGDSKAQRYVNSDNSVKQDCPQNDRNSAKTPNNQQCSNTIQTGKSTADVNIIVTMDM